MIKETTYQPEWIYEVKKRLGKKYDPKLIENTINRTKKCKGTGNNSRIIGDKCVANRQCKNRNCVNNVCTRNNSTRRRTSNNLNTNMLFGNSGGRNTRKNY